MFTLHRNCCWISCSIWSGCTVWLNTTSHSTYYSEPRWTLGPALQLNKCWPAQAAEHDFSDATGISTHHGNVCTMWRYRYVRSVQTLVSVTCSGGLLVVGGTAPEDRHCTGECWCYQYLLQCATATVPLARQRRQRTTAAATSARLGRDRSRVNQRLGLPPVKETSQTL